MKRYAVHFKTLSKSQNVLRHHEVVIVQVNTTTPFAGFLQRYINERLPEGETCLIFSVLDITTDNLYAQVIHEASKIMFFKEVLTIKFKSPKNPNVLVIEEEEA